MRILYLCVIFSICGACNDQNSNQNYQIEAKPPNIINELIGIWDSDQSDIVTKNSIGKVTMTFTEDSQLLYNIDTGDEIQKINLIYKISGDTIISDQPSHPQVQKTKFKIENGNKLILEYEGEKTVFTRETK